MKVFAALLSVACGVVLPILSVGYEVRTHICGSAFYETLPSPAHVFYFLIVPLGNLATLIALRREPAPWWMQTCNLIAITVSGLYTVMVLPVLPIAVMAIPLGGVGLLALSPILSLGVALTLRLQAGQSHDERRPHPFKVGCLALVVFVCIDIVPTHVFLAMATSDAPDTHLLGLQLLRWMGDRQELLRWCYDGTAGDDARRAFYQTTGVPFNRFPRPRLMAWTPDNDLGSDQVGGRVPTLFLRTSQMSSRMEPVGCLTYYEWTLEFENRGAEAQEARLQIALPAGAVVSRMTLWMDGYAKEATFSGRGSARGAYQEIVRFPSQNMDPSLVSTCGPDAVLLQCYPVPAHGGTMKVRVGITAPWVATSQTTGTVRLPAFQERNFNMPPGFSHSIDTASLSDDQLTKQAAIPVQGQARRLDSEVAGGIIFVVDGSASMQSRLPQVAAELQTVQQPVDILFAGDTVQHVQARDLASMPCIGGQDNGPELCEALERSNERTAVVWIHGPQALELDDPIVLRTRLDSGTKARLFDMQVVPGANRTLERLDGARHLIRFPGSLAELLVTLDGAPTYAFIRHPSSHSGDVDARERVDLLRQSSIGEACDEAIKHHIVTVVSSAVITPTSIPTAPDDPYTEVATVPEPAARTLAALVVIILLAAWRRFAVA